MLTPPPPQDSTETDIEDVVPLPPVIINNPREKIVPKMIPSHMIKKKNTGPVEKKKFAALIWVPLSDRVVKPVPRNPIYMSWWPQTLCFKIDKDVVEQKLHFNNCSTHLMYIMYCGLWDDRARDGASWKCYPGTRFLLAPGMGGSLSIRAKPRGSSSVPNAFAGLQLAAAHPRDYVTGYFVVPVAVHFHNYVPSNSSSEAEPEQETSEPGGIGNTSHVIS